MTPLFRLTLPITLGSVQARLLDRDPKWVTDRHTVRQGWRVPEFRGHYTKLNSAPAGAEEEPTARLSRIVIPDAPYYVTQPDNWRLKLIQHNLPFAQVLTKPLPRRLLMNRQRLGLLTLASAITMIAQVAAAAETITYEYDARGRLKKVVHTGDVNSNVQTIYNLDKADNRTTVTTTGAP